MEKKLNFTDQALNQINLITKGDEKKYFRIEAYIHSQDMLDKGIEILEGDFFSFGSI